MSAIYVMIPFALLLGGGFVVAFIMMASKGQYDDLYTPAHQVLLDDQPCSDSVINQERQKNES
jgi:cbb3-type cytochrome oxidase maturation protein